MTGPLANLGKDNQDGFNLYLDSIHGTIAGRKVQVTVADDQGKADVGLTKAKELVESDKVQVLMGITPTPVCYAVAEYVKQVQVPLIVTGNCGAEGLNIDPKFKSPYLTRFTQTSSQMVDPAADWAIKQGHRKAIVVMADFGGGLEAGDFFASAFVGRGGTVVQELYPPLGTADYGPLVAQLDQSADLLAVFLPGVDSLRFDQQYANYSGKNKPQILDLFGVMTTGSNLEQLKDKAVGVISEYAYSTAYDDPVNKAFLKAWAAKYPNRTVSLDAANGYAGAQVLEAALKKVNGQIEQKQQFLDALDNINIDTAKGPLKLDSDHDVIQNIYIYQTVKQGNTLAQKLLQTYPAVSKYWDRSAQQVEKFQYGKLKGKWVGMTKEKLGDVLTLK